MLGVYPVPVATIVERVSPPTALFRGLQATGRTVSWTIGTYANLVRGSMPVGGPSNDGPILMDTADLLALLLINGNLWFLLYNLLPLPYSDLFTAINYALGWRIPEVKFSLFLFFGPMLLVVVVVLIGDVLRLWTLGN